MKLKIDPLTENALTVMRRAGYSFQKNEGTEQAWVRVLGSSGYPRFHIYTKQEKMALFLNLHLDQKKHTYREETRHHGEYTEESMVLKEEANRLLTALGESATMGETEKS